MQTDEALVTRLQGMVAVIQGRPAWVEPNQDVRDNPPTVEERACEIERFLGYDLPLALLYLTPGMHLPLIRVYDGDVDHSSSPARVGLGAQDLVRTQNLLLLDGPILRLVTVLQELQLFILFQRRKIRGRDGTSRDVYSLCISLRDA